MAGLEKEAFIFSYSYSDTRYISLLSLPTSGPLEFLLRVCVIGVTKGSRRRTGRQCFQSSEATGMQKVKRTEQVWLPCCIPLESWKSTDMVAKSEQQS